LTASRSTTDHALARPRGVGKLEEPPQDTRGITGIMPCRPLQRAAAKLATHLLWWARWAVWRSPHQTLGGHRHYALPSLQRAAANRQRTRSGVRGGRSGAAVKA